MPNRSVAQEWKFALTYYKRAVLRRLVGILLCCIQIYNQRNLGNGRHNEDNPGRMWLSSIGGAGS